MLKCKICCANRFQTFYIIQTMLRMINNWILSYAFWRRIWIFISYFYTRMPVRGCTQARTQLTQHTHARAHPFAYRLIFFIFNFQAIVETTSDKQNELTRNLKIHCQKYCSVKISIVKNCFVIRSITRLKCVIQK